jgi:caffeic acid 3-O-methyltransferase
MQLILHGCGDEESLLILQNCFKALSQGGKVILAEYVLNDGQEKSATHRYAEFQDIKMMSVHKGGKERTKEEYQTLLEAAGFSDFRLIASEGGMDLVQGTK